MQDSYEKRSRGEVSMIFKGGRASIEDVEVAAAKARQILLYSFTKLVGVQQRSFSRYGIY